VHCNRVEVVVDLHVAKGEEAVTTGLQVVRQRQQQELASLRRHRVRDDVVERWEFEDLACGEKTTVMLVRKETKKRKTYLDCMPANGVAGNGSGGCGS